MDVVETPPPRTAIVRFRIVDGVHVGGDPDRNPDLCFLQPGVAAACSLSVPSRSRVALATKPVVQSRLHTGAAGYRLALARNAWTEPRLRGAPSRSRST